MNSEEARTILRDHVHTFRAWSYADLVSLLGKPRIAEAVGPSGATYHLEVEVHWESRPGGNVRVRGAIDDGGVRAFKPLIDGFILAPNGLFVEE